MSSPLNPRGARSSGSTRAAHVVAQSPRARARVCLRRPPPPHKGYNYLLLTAASEPSNQLCIDTDTFPGYKAQVTVDVLLLLLLLLLPRWFMLFSFFRVVLRKVLREDDVVRRRGSRSM